MSRGDAIVLSIVGGAVLLVLLWVALLWLTTDITGPDDTRYEG